MDIIQRGNPSLLKSIQIGAKKVSESRGISNERIFPTQTTSPTMIQEAGAFASMQRRQMSEIPRVRSNELNVSKGSYSIAEKRLLDRLCESVETLGVTKEYFNATSSLFTLYTMGELTEGVMNTITREDLREIKGILREFKSVIDSY